MIILISTLGKKVLVEEIHVSQNVRFLYIIID